MTTCGSPMRVLAALLFVSVSAMAQDRASVIDQLLEDTEWTLAFDPVEYTPEAIEALVGESAESVLEYGLIGATQLTFEGPEGDVETTLYEMIDSSASFGLFSLGRDWTDASFELAVVGSEGYRTGTELVLWQSRYVASLNGPRDATNALGQSIANNVLGQSRKAPVSLFLPAEGLVRESEKYILTPEALRRITGLDPAELGFDNSVEVATADYQRATGTGRLALFLYPTQQLAALHSEAWIESQANDAAYARSGPLFAIVFESEGPELADAILSTLRYQTEITWTDTLPDPLTLSQLILTIFEFIGIALAFTLIVGLVFGGFRIYMKTRYPGLIFGTEEEVEFIQLKLDQGVTGKKLNP
jgi:hypothetical protein